MHFYSAPFKLWGRIFGQLATLVFHITKLPPRNEYNSRKPTSFCLLQNVVFKIVFIAMGGSPVTISSHLLGISNCRLEAYAVRFEAEFMNVSLSFLGIILKVLRLEVSVWGFLKTKERRYGFLSCFPPFSLEIVKGCMSLKQYLRGCESSKK